MERLSISRQVLAAESDESPSSSSSYIPKPGSEGGLDSGLSTTYYYCDPSEATMIVELRVKIEMNVLVGRVVSCVLT